MDYRYETKDEAREFHKRRKTFIILNDMLEFLPEESKMSHFEYCQIPKENFALDFHYGKYSNGTIKKEVK